MAHVIVKPGGLRELHGHPNANKWQYYLQSTDRMTVFFAAAEARTMDFTASDVGYVPQTFGHYIGNAGDHDLSFSNSVSHVPEQLIMDHLRISPETLKAIPRGDSTVVPS